MQRNLILLQVGIKTALTVHVNEHYAGTSALLSAFIACASKRLPRLVVERWNFERRARRFYRVRECTVVVSSSGGLPDGVSNTVIPGSISSSSVCRWIVSPADVKSNHN